MRRGIAIGISVSIAACAGVCTHAGAASGDGQAGTDASATGSAGGAATTEAWVRRVGGDMQVELESRPGREGDLYSSDGVYTDTKLAVGYPVPTPPSAIELKHYPVFRRAEVSGRGDGGSSGRTGFMPLFRHISSNDIAMTAPVEMEYRDFDEDDRTDAWTMAFLYHSPEDGPTGRDMQGVRIVDADAVTVLSLGVRGGRDITRVSDLEALLETWLDSQNEWQRIDGAPVRVLGYNGPSTPVSNRWWEVQLPVEPSRENVGELESADESAARARQLMGLASAMERNAQRG